MDQGRSHRMNPDFNAALAQLLHQLNDRQHGVDLYRVVARHGDEDAGLGLCIIIH